MHSTTTNKLELLVAFTCWVVFLEHYHTASGKASLDIECHHWIGVLSKMVSCKMH